jgi:hypothetical protein
MKPANYLLKGEPAILGDQHLLFMLPLASVKIYLKAEYMVNFPNEPSICGSRPIHPMDIRCDI